MEIGFDLLVLDASLVGDPADVLGEAMRRFVVIKASEKTWGVIVVGAQQRAHPLVGALRLLALVERLFRLLVRTRIKIGKGLLPLPPLRCAASLIGARPSLCACPSLPAWQLSP